MSSTAIAVPLAAGAPDDRPIGETIALGTDAEGEAVEIGVVLALRPVVDIVEADPLAELAPRGTDLSPHATEEIVSTERTSLASARGRQGGARPVIERKV